MIIQTIHKFINWYFSRNALPYWCILAADCLLLFCFYLFGYYCFIGGDGIVVRNGHGVQPHPRRHLGQALDGDGAVRTGGMIVKIAGHCVSSHESPKSTRPKRANAFSASYQCLVLIEIDEAAVGQDLAFVRSQRSHIQGERLDGPAQHIGGDVL